LVRTITPTVVRVQKKVEKAADRIILAGQLAKEHLAATKAREKAQKERNKAPNKVVQKYREIYGHQARRQIADDEEDEGRVINMREKRLTDPWRKKYKEIIKTFPVVYRTLRDEGRFIFLASYKKLLLPF
jgi:hypothetical protein